MFKLPFTLFASDEKSSACVDEQTTLLHDTGQGLANVRLSLNSYSGTVYVNDAPISIDSLAGPINLGAVLIGSSSSLCSPSWKFSCLSSLSAISLNKYIIISQTNGLLVKFEYDEKYKRYLPPANYTPKGSYLIATYNGFEWYSLETGEERCYDKQGLLKKTKNK